MALPYIPKRYILTLLAHFGFFVVYMLRVNLSVALVAMVNATATHASTTDPECRTKNVTTNSDKDGEFVWSQNQQGFILSSFFYGYLVTQIPGGWLANTYGAKWVFGLGVLATSALTLVTPVAARGGFAVLIVVRVLEGIGEGVTFPAMHAMIAQWSPPAERSRMAVMSYAGMQSGTIFSLPVSGVLADSSFLGGWPSVFYTSGVLGFIWFAIWMFMVSNTPEKHSTISYEEKRFILNSLKESSSNTKEAAIPWFQILTSPPVIACIVAHFCNNWSWYMILTGLPSYFKQVLDFNITQSGFLSALPFIVGFFAYLGAGVFADFVRRRYLSTTTTRKLLGIVAFFPSGIFLILASYAGCDQIALSVAYMALSTGFMCLNSAAYSVNMIDLSPRFAGIIMGISNFWGTVAGCITPSITGYFTNDQPTRRQYRKVFLIAACISFFGGVFYTVFAKGTQQPWNDFSLTTSPSTSIQESIEERTLLSEDHPTDRMLNDTME